MAKYAQVKDGIVVNLVVWDGEAEFPQPEGVTLAPIDGVSGVEIGAPFPN
jgi:hypothetical protein